MNWKHRYYVRLTTMMASAILGLAMIFAGLSSWHNTDMKSIETQSVNGVAGLGGFVMLFIGAILILFALLLVRATDRARLYSGMQASRIRMPHKKELTR